MVKEYLTILLYIFNPTNVPCMSITLIFATSPISHTWISWCQYFSPLCDSSPVHCGLGEKKRFTVYFQGVTRRCAEKMHEPSWWRRILSWQSALSKLCLGSCMRCTAHLLALLLDTSALEPSSGSSTLLMQSCWRMCWGTMLCPGNASQRLLANFNTDITAGSEDISLV